MNVSKEFMRAMLTACIGFAPCLYDEKTETYGNKEFWYKHYICFSTDGYNKPLVALELWDRNAIRCDYPKIIFYAEYDEENFGWMEC